MPRPHPPEFRQRAVELAQLREQPIGKIEWSPPEWCATTPLTGVADTEKAATA